MRKELYIYIHIPFCYRKCPYCGFVSYEKSFSLLDRYVEALKREIRNFREKSYYRVKTVYFGGGTPTVLKPKHIELILNEIEKHFSLDMQEMTIEAIPNDVKRSYLLDLKLLGFNRLSLGIQSLRDEKLKKLGRIHNSKMAVKAVDIAHSSGFENISVDLIYGIDDSVSLFQEELNRVLKLPIKHISAYMLTVIEGTPFFNLRKDGKLALNSDDEIVEIYKLLCEKLDKHGFHQYEISNFSKSGFESIHNMAYWTAKEYAGFGVQAASFLDGKRVKNTDSLDEYIKNPEGSWTVEEFLEGEALAREMFVLGLRLKRGVDLEEFRFRFGYDIKELFYEELDKFLDIGLLKLEDGRVFLNGCEAMLVSNSIFAHFI